MRTIIAGTRTAEYHHVHKAMCGCPFANQITEIVCGCAKGADTHGRAWAEFRGIPIKFFPAEWDAYGKQAGPIRNTKMAENADALILVWNGRSPGSASMLKIAKIYKLTIHEYIYE
jgi:hypothetical protein